MCAVKGLPRDAAVCVAIFGFALSMGSGCSRSRMIQDGAVSRDDGPRAEAVPPLDQAVDLPMKDAPADALGVDVPVRGVGDAPTTDSRPWPDSAADTPNVMGVDALADLGSDSPDLSSDVTLCPFVAGDGGLAESDGGVGRVAVVTHDLSTNQWGAKLTLFCDGSALCEVLPCRMLHLSGYCSETDRPTTTALPSGTPWVVQCLADLQTVGDVSTIRTVSNMENCESVSNGNEVTIAYGSSKTNDLNCSLQSLTQAQAKLLNDCLAWTCAGRRRHYEDYTPELP